MSEYIVTMPIYGAVEIYVEAENERDAIEKAREGQWLDHEEVEWSVSEGCQGNVCYRTEHNSIKVELNDLAQGGSG